jgi:hypothetical protein
MFQSTCFQDEEFSLLWPSLDASEHAKEFIVECMTASASDPDTASNEST